MTSPPRPGQRWTPAAGDPLATRVVVACVALLLVTLLLIAPLGVIAQQATSRGLGPMWAALTHPHAVHAFWLTAVVAAWAVPLNAFFGVVTAWSVTKFDFPGKSVLTTLIDLPMSVSPVMSGMVWVLLFGAHGWLGPTLQAQGIQVVFALPGMVLATVFVTFPYVARGLIPLMAQQGRDDEEAAITLGASAWQAFWRVTLPNIRWGLLYGTLLCTARAVGEFGAVSVVSGHVLGRTMTAPLHVETLYNDFQAPAAFAVALGLCVLGLVTLAAKALLELRLRAELRDRGRPLDAA